jgi:beta-lactamase class A
MRRSSSFLSWLSIFFFLSALVLTVLQLVQYSRIRTNFPDGLVMAGIPVGGLNRQQAAERLLEVYSVPVELHYFDSVVHVLPGVVEFELDIESMLAAADLQRTEEPFWSGFWDYLLGRQQTPNSVPLRASYSEDRLRAYLIREIKSRYDIPATSVRPAVGTVNFLPGTPGTALDVDGSVLQIENALFSTSARIVDLPLQQITPPRLTFENLAIVLRQVIDVSGFDGLVGLYLMDLQTAQEIHFAYQQGEYLSVQPDVAFTAASIIKIPIMVSVFQRIDEEPDSETIRLLEQMIELSGNEPADWVMERVIDPRSGPIGVTEDLQELGLDNSFLAGQFYPGAPLLAIFDTPANQRLDVDTQPDIYNQTTPSDIGMLLADIYQCAQGNGGTLTAIYGEAINQQECQSMIAFLIRNRLPVLITNGLPEGTQIAHKHGWVTDGDGVINTIGDAGIVYTPGGNYVLVIFLYHPVQLVWEPSANLIADLSESIFNYYNTPQR